jgi:hypothetical protein
MTNEGTLPVMAKQSPKPRDLNQRAAAIVAQATAEHEDDEDGIRVIWHWAPPIISRQDRAARRRRDSSSIEAYR